MHKTAAAITRGFAAQDTSFTKLAAQGKTAAKQRWLEDSDLVKLCELCKQHGKKK